MKKKINAPAAQKPPRPRPGRDKTEPLYQQLDEVLRSTGFSKAKLAINIGMTYPGFLLALKHRRLKVDNWLDIAEFLHLPLTLSLGEIKFAQAVNQVPAVQSDYTSRRLRNAEELVDIYEERIGFLRAQIDQLERKISQMK